MYFHYHSGVDEYVDVIVSAMSEKAEEMGIPAVIKQDTIREGGLFDHTYPCVVIEQPNPPQKYFTDVHVINKNIINFYYFGESKVNTANNKAKARSNTLAGKILNSISGSNTLAWQQELNWHEEILDIFVSLAKDELLWDYLVNRANVIFGNYTILSKKIFV